MGSTQPTVNTTESAGGGLILGLRISSGFLAVSILIQAWLGSTGFFQNAPSRVDVHGVIGNVIFLVASVQVVLAFLALQKGLVSQVLLASTAVTLILVVAQIGLGYSTRDSADAIAWHIPNGVLLMATCTWNAIGSWSAPNRS